MNKVKSNQYNLIKTITTVLVVIAHATRMYTGVGVVVPLNGSEVLSYITKFIYAFHMPLFMCVSGMVYGMCIDDLGKYNDTKKFIVKKATRLLIPYYAFGLIVVAPVMTIFNFTEQTYLKYVFSGIGLVRNSRHLWFIFTLFVIFVICAIFKKQIQKWNAFCVLPILLVGSFISQYMPITFSINVVMHYCLFFYLGYVLNKNYEKAVKYSKNPFILLLATVILAFLCTKGGWLIGIVTAMAGIVLMLGIVQYISHKVFDNKIYRVLNGTSFGVYLFHPMIIYVLFYFFGAMDINPILLCSAIIIASYLFSMVATYIVRKIRLGVLIGE